MADKTAQAEMEAAIIGILKEVFQIDEVGVDDNFFDLGGNSLLLVTVQEKLQELIGREIQPVDVFNHPTVALLAGFLSTADDPAAAPPERPMQDRSDELKTGRDRLKRRLQQRRRPSARKIGE